MGNTPADGRPDVQIRSTVRIPGTDLEGRVLQVQHTASCCWCPESFMTPDVRSAVKWADSHEQSLAHTYGKQERIADGIGPRDPWAAVGV